MKGKTVTETLATPAELHKAQREVEAYHRFRQLAQALLEINEKICRARPVEQELVPAKKTAEIIQQEVAREAEHLLQLLLGAGEQTAPLDLEAVEMAIRGSMHQAGAAVLSQLLEFPPPSSERQQRACGARARYVELRSKPVLTAVGSAECVRP